MKSSLANPEKKPVVFLYLGESTSTDKPELFRLIEPHLNDIDARRDLGRANYLAQEANIDCRFIYRHLEPDAIIRVWRELHPQTTIVGRDHLPKLLQIKPKRIKEKSTLAGQVMYLMA